jgi:hypothetical protein
LRIDLPDEGEPLNRRLTASVACWRLYGEVLGHESEWLAGLGRLHQLTVDTYGAQHAGGHSPAIATAFGLIGLRLALEDGMTGAEVRAAHQYLAQRFRTWPVFDPPSTTWQVTVIDVAAAGSSEAHEEAVSRWAADVWSSWRHEHDRVAGLVGERLPPDVRGRLASQ